MKTKLILGIDPSKGWALAGHRFGSRCVECVGSVEGIEQLLPKITGLAAQYRIDMVRIEKPINNYVYPRLGVNVRAMMKIAVNVGMNSAKADRIKAHCEGLGLACEFIAPIRHGTKRGKDFIKQLTGYTGRSNEHSRDALVIAWMG